MPWCVRSLRVWRVSSAAITSTLPRMRRARKVMSARLPIGVETTYRVPASADSSKVASGSWLRSKEEVTACLLRHVLEKSPASPPYRPQKPHTPTMGGEQKEHPKHRGTTRSG